ncbi:hypothetical protein GCM10009784_27050 [Arthrobacter parietis]|uniref:DNA methylase N-4/N-6 domain-containing protein n=1 Tax=Arthrobacter parietis TaxID=271434 RepID=A0ABN3B040_9MICC
MSRLNDLLRRLSTSDASLAADLKREVDALADRRAFGLNFERHVPEAVELPGRKVRKGDKVRVLPRRGEHSIAENRRLWRVLSINRTSDPATAVLGALDGEVAQDVAVDDLIVVAEFRDPIYPGLVSTGKVKRGGDKPFHTVINAENFHALQTLLFTHRGKVDCIYIDPPYNTGAKDWKYSNDYVEGDDLYRHSKWLAFMERRLLLAKELLNPNDSVLIVTIDEKEYLRLGMLLEQTFSEARIQMVTSVINPSGVARGRNLVRVDEYVFIVMVGEAGPSKWLHNMLDTKREDKKAGTIWRSLQRAGTNSLRTDRPNLFYPVWVIPESQKIHSVGDPISLSEPRDQVLPSEPGLIPVWPIRADGSEGRWQIGHLALRKRIAEGTARLGAANRSKTAWAINYLREAELSRIESGQLIVRGKDTNGALVVEWSEQTGASSFSPATVWNVESHNAGAGGSNIIRALMPHRKFPFPKSLYAVEDALRFFVSDKPNAVVLDFFAGSGTTAHAVMRLNRQDAGRRQCISVTNNEVSADEQHNLRKKGLRPGDNEWEELGICDFITKARIRAAISGSTPEGNPIDGEYKVTDEFPMSDGFEENAEFFTLTYESALRVSSHREFAKIAPLLWIRAGSGGRRIEDIAAGWDVADTYGVIADLNQTEGFLKEVVSNEGVSLVYIVTDEDRLFESVVRELPEHVEPVRLYEAYLRNFEIETGRNSQ